MITGCCSQGVGGTGYLTDDEDDGGSDDDDDADDDVLWRAVP